MIDTREELTVAPHEAAELDRATEPRPAMALSRSR